MMLTIFSGEKPTYVTEDELSGFSAKIVFSSEGDSVRCETTIYRDDKEALGEATESVSGKTELEINRLCQKVVRLSFYRAAVPSFSPHLPWGMLTGIRPARNVSTMLEKGLSDSDAICKMQEEYYVSPERAALSLMTAKESLKVSSSLNPNDICLYVGIPFCPTKCAYCSFVSNSVEKSNKLVEPYINALFNEIETTSKALSDLGLNIISVYIGGGTPTTLTAEQLDRLLTQLALKFDLSNIKEYTVEAGRPDTLSYEKLDVLEKHSVTRISINPQTMSDSVLKTIGRAHTASDIISAMEMASKYKFHVNMDLIAGLPEDTEEGFNQSLDAVMAYGAENITVHTLALKKGSRIMEDNVKIPSAENVRAMIDYSRESLLNNGYNPYYLYRQKYISGGFENVGYSLSGTENLYNICIMEELCSIISVGAGGSTKLVSQVNQGKIHRLFNPKYPFEYISRDKQKDKIYEFYNGEVK